MTKSELLSMIGALVREVSLLKQRVTYLEAQRAVLPPAEPAGNVFWPSMLGGDHTKAVSGADIEAYGAAAANEHVFERLRRWWDAKDVRKHGYNPPPDPWVGAPEKPPLPPKMYAT